MDPDRIRIIIADDQNLFAEGLKSIIEVRDPGISVEAIAPDGREAVRLTRQLKPDIVLMDVLMPIMDGVEAVKILHTEQPELKILMLTTFDDDEYVKEALWNGALGYLLKNVPVNDLIRNIRALHENAVIMTPSVMRNLIRPSPQAAVRKELPPWFDSLALREKQILRLLAEGRNNYDIAGCLNLSEQTVKNYISGIYAKAGSHDRLALIKSLEGCQFPELG